MKQWRTIYEIFNNIVDVPLMIQAKKVEIAVTGDQCSTINEMRRKLRKQICDVIMKHL